MVACGQYLCINVQACGKKQKCPALGTGIGHVWRRTPAHLRNSANHLGRHEIADSYNYAFAQDGSWLPEREWKPSATSSFICPQKM